MKDYSLTKVSVGEYKALVSFGLDETDIASVVIYKELGERVIVLKTKNIGNALLYFNYDNRRRYIERLKKEMECLE